MSAPFFVLRPYPPSASAPLCVCTSAMSTASVCSASSYLIAIRRQCLLRSSGLTAIHRQRLLHYAHPPLQCFPPSAFAPLCVSAARRQCSVCSILLASGVVGVCSVLRASVLSAVNVLRASLSLQSTVGVCSGLRTSLLSTASIRSIMRASVLATVSVCSFLRASVPSTVSVCSIFISGCCCLLRFFVPSAIHHHHRCRSVLRASLLSTVSAARLASVLLTVSVCSVSSRLTAVRRPPYFVPHCHPSSVLLPLCASQCCVCSVLRSPCPSAVHPSVSAPFVRPRCCPPSVFAPVFVPQCCPLLVLLHYARLSAVHRQCLSRSPSVLSTVSVCSINIIPTPACIQPKKQNLCTHDSVVVMDINDLQHGMQLVIRVH